MAFPAVFLDELVQRNPIDEVVGQYVSLTRKGANLFGLCPFHSEKTPSFNVNEESLAKSALIINLIVYSAVSLMLRNSSPGNSPLTATALSSKMARINLLSISPRLKALRDTNNNLSISLSSLFSLV